MLFAYAGMSVCKFIFTRCRIVDTFFKKLDSVEFDFTIEKNEAKEYSQFSFECKKISHRSVRQSKKRRCLTHKILESISHKQAKRFSLMWIYSQEPTTHINSSTMVPFSMHSVILRNEPDADTKFCTVINYARTSDGTQENTFFFF